MKGFLEKRDNVWHVRWSDLHSFAHGTHWMWTPFHPHQIIDETIYKEGDSVEVKFTYTSDDDGGFYRNTYALFTKSKMKDIKEITLELLEKYRSKYTKWCEENPGKIMNGNLSKEDTMKKAYHCKNINEIRAMRTYYDIALRSASGPNGFIFCRDAIDELLEVVYSNNGYTENDATFYE